MWMFNTLVFMIGELARIFLYFDFMEPITRTYNVDEDDDESTDDHYIDVGPNWTLLNEEPIEIPLLDGTGDNFRISI